MMLNALLRGLAILAMLAPAALTTAAVMTDTFASTFTVPLQSKLVPAQAYRSPDAFIPSPTGIFGQSSDASMGSQDASAWVALRSPVGNQTAGHSTAATTGGSVPKFWRSPIRRGRWKGRQTRGRPVHDLEMQIARYGVENWVYPIDERLIAGSPFGRRKSPITGEGVLHQGQDIGCSVGMPIYAAADGKVRYSHDSLTAGRYVEIHHGTWGDKLVKTRYLHMSRRMVSKGDIVRMGQRIGSCGNTGNSTGPHLHFSLLHGEKSINPFVVYEAVLKGEEAEMRAWDEAIALAIEEGTLDELVDGDSVPREVRKVVSEYKRRKGKRPPRKLYDGGLPGDKGRGSSSAADEVQVAAKTSEEIEGDLTFEPLVFIDADTPVAQEPEIVEPAESEPEGETEVAEDDEGAVEEAEEPEGDEVTSFDELEAEPDGDDGLEDGEEAEDQGAPADEEALDESEAAVDGSEEPSEDGEESVEEEAIAFDEFDDEEEPTAARVTPPEDLSADELLEARGGAEEDDDDAADDELVEEESEADSEEAPPAEEPDDAAPEESAESSD